MKIPEQWIHMGHDRIDIKEFNPIQNEAPFPKPIGGLWASPLQINNPYYSDWQEFSEYIWGKVKNEKSVIFRFKKNTKIYVIDTQDDLIKLIEEVGKGISPLPISTTVTIDFEKAKDTYDVIYLTKKGQRATRIPLSQRDYNLNGWDCESCLILNPHVIEKQMAVKIR